MEYRQIVEGSKRILSIESGIDLRHRQTFITNQIILYQVMVASEDLLLEAIERSSGDLQDYFKHHLKEERNHAEWQLQDLAALGVDAKEMPLCRYACEMVGLQFYLIRYKSPLALLGYMAVLEGSTLTDETADELRSLYGVNGTRNLMHHVEHDKAHSRDLEIIINRYRDPLIEMSAFQTAQYIHEIGKYLQSIKNGD